MDKKSSRHQSSPLPGKPVFVCAGVLFALGIIVAVKVPVAHALYAFAEVTLLLSFMPVLFWWQSKSVSPTPAKIAAIASVVLWIIGIVLAFVIPPQSFLIPIPDTLLLLGFLPLLFQWRFSLPWIIFGLFNFAIGFLLQTIEFIPNDVFPAETLATKAHLAAYHTPLPWLIIGGICTLIGFVRFGKNIAVWSSKKPTSNEVDR